MKKPILLIKKELVQHITQALERIEKIRQRKARNEDKIIHEGLFILAVSSFENSINDTLRYFLTHIPSKLDNTLSNISKEDIIDGDPLDRAIENKINALSYKNLSEIISYFIKITGTSQDCISDQLQDKLHEIKATRNLLLHNNLKVNSIYKETAGNLARGTEGSELELDEIYLYNSIVILREILDVFKAQLLEKYDDYTRVNAIKRLWIYMFPTPLLRNEDQWLIDEEIDVVRDFNIQRRTDLSSSEEFLLSIWLSHFQGNGISTGNGSFYTLGKINKRKLAYFISVAEILKTL